MFFAGLGGTAGASMPQAGASSQAPANQRAASSLTTATRLFVAQRHSRRALRVSGICTASRLHLHSCTRVASSSASSSRCLFWRAPPWPSVRLLVSRCWHTRRRKFTPPTPLLDLPSEAASKRRPPPPPCRTSSPGTSRPVASVRLPQLTPGSIAIINSDKVPRAAPPHKNLAWLT